jgi:hypothetical protein
LSAEIVDKSKQVDGLVIWDMVCGTIGRPCPKLGGDAKRLTEVGQYSVPPPCIFLFPATIPAPRNNPAPFAHQLKDVEFLSILHTAFKGADEEIATVLIEARYRGPDLERLTKVLRGGVVAQASDWTPIQRA